MERDSQEWAEEPSHTEFLSSSVFSPLGSAPAGAEAASCLPSTIAAGRAGRKHILAKGSSFASYFLLQLKRNYLRPNVSWCWNPLVMKALATACQAPGFVYPLCIFLSSHETHPAALSRPEEVKHGRYWSIFYFRSALGTRGHISRLMWRNPVHVFASRVGNACQLQMLCTGLHPSLIIPQTLTLLKPSAA